MKRFDHAGSLKFTEQHPFQGPADSSMTTARIMITQNHERKTKRVHRRRMYLVNCNTPIYLCGALEDNILSK